MGSVNQSTNLTVGTVSSTGGHAVQSTKGDSGPASSEQTGFNTPVTAGDTYVVFSHWDGASITVASLTDTLGNTFVPIGGPFDFGTQHGQVWYAKIVNGGPSDSITITYSSATTSYSLLDVVEYSGLNTTTPFASYVHATGTGTTLNSGSISVATANTQTLIGVFSDDGHASPYTLASGFTKDLDVETSSEIGSMPITAAGSYSASATTSSSFDWIAFALLFNNASN